jgi:hypothetical protein
MIERKRDRVRNLLGDGKMRRASDIAREIGLPPNADSVAKVLRARCSRHPRREVRLLRGERAMSDTSQAPRWTRDEIETHDRGRPHGDPPLRRRERHATGGDRRPRCARTASLLREHGIALVDVFVALLHRTAHRELPRVRTVNCEMTSRVSKSARYAKIASVPNGTLSPCAFVASRSCPACGKQLCNGHSRHLTSMGGNLERARYRRCSACGHEWIP